MSETKREGLERFKKAQEAYEGGRISALDRCRIEADVLAIEGVKPQNIKDIKADTRARCVKNS